MYEIFFRKVDNMQYTAPHYLKEFKCTAAACPMTCCAGWQIQIDPASLKKYRRIKGPLGSRLRNEINWKEGCFRRYNSRCAFLNEAGLCDLYLEGGGNRAFCRTCRTYPRHIEEFEGLREISLSLSCPAAAELILFSDEPVRFLHGEKPSPDETYDEFDFLLFTKLMDARNLIFHILQNRTRPFSVRAAVTLSLAHDLQERIDRNALFDADALFERYSSPAVWEWFEDRLDSLKAVPGSIEIYNATRARLFSMFSHFEVLCADWPDYLERIRHIYEEESENRCSSFDKIFTDVMSEQLFIYFIFTYFCGAVYNQNAYGKAKFAFAGTFLIRELIRGEWLKSPGTSDRASIIRTACRYSREIEHSDINKIKMEQFLDKGPYFELEKLFCLL